MALEWRNLNRNLAAGWRIACLRRVRPDAIEASPTQVVLLALAGLLLQLGSDIARVGWNGHPTTWGLPGALFPVVLILFAAWALVAIGRLDGKLAGIATGVLGAALSITVVTWALAWGLSLLPRSQAVVWLRWAAWYLPPFWLGLAASVHGARLIDASAWRRVLAAAAVAAIVAVPLSTTWLERELWAANEDAERLARANDWDVPVREDVLYRQPKLLEHELAAVQPASRSQPTLYFVGVAAYGGQDVFMREMQSVTQLFAQRFDTAGHSITLINSRTTAYDTPWATVTALRASLARVAASMQRERDVLFLYLSSHGSREHRLSFQLSPLQFDDLDPATLRKLLDESGIRHRVVVVSACYSGGFVDALKGDDTLVITASAPDRNSFGCSNDAEFTYFGKAYFDEALRRTHSFTEAFRIAQAAVTAREKEAGYEPSNPQIDIGRNIESTLQGLPYGADPAHAKQHAATPATSRASRHACVQAQPGTHVSARRPCRSRARGLK